MLLHPEQLVASRRGVVPRRRREQVDVEQGGEFSVRLDRARHRIHEREDPGRIVVVAAVRLGVLRTQSRNPAHEVDERGVKALEGAK